jgi:methylenetetrahydrofolate reductase (NADPH)
MPIMTYSGFKRMTGFCKTIVPEAISTKLESIKDDDEAVKQFGIDLGVEVGTRAIQVSAYRGEGRSLYC